MQGVAGTLQKVAGGCSCWLVAGHAIDDGGNIVGLLASVPLQRC